MDPNETASPDRGPNIRLSTSCDYCFNSKLKCSKEKPVCRRCKRFGKDCIYSEGTPREREPPTSSSSTGFLTEASNSAPRVCIPRSSPLTNRYCSACGLYFREQLYDNSMILDTPTSYKTMFVNAVRIHEKRKACLVCDLICTLLLQGLVSNEELRIDYSHRRCDLWRRQRWIGFVTPLSILERRLHAGTTRLEIRSLGWTKLQCRGALDLEMVRSWIKNCESSHKSEKTLHELGRAKDPIDLTLIDVVDNRLVRASSSVRFCSLSYVWGDTQSLNTTTENRLKLASRGALRDPRTRTMISRVVQDAMLLVAGIGERYLWVDALCIEQDNAAMKHAQIMQMDVIYSSALLTIVTLSGQNADTALPNFVPIKAPNLCDIRKYPKEQEAFDLYYNGIVAVGPSLHQTLHESTYNTRGWTFQERLLSQRCLYLSENSAFLRCHYETQTEFPCEADPAFHDLDLIPKSKLPSGIPLYANFSDNIDRSAAEVDSTYFDHYARLLIEYRNKQLSYASDALSAFSGILAALSHRCGWHYVSGVPEEHLDLGILWSPVFTHRVERNEGFASWSWAGWHCPISWRLIVQFRMEGVGIPMARTELEDVQTFQQSRRRALFHKQHFEHRQQSQTSAEVHKHTSPRAEVSKLIDILSFRARTISVIGFQLCWESREGITYISDRRGRTCGFCHVPNDMKGETMEWVCLSRFQHSDATWSNFTSYLTLRASILNIGYLEKEYPFSEWSLLNVMLIRWKDEQAERVSIGVIHEEAFNEAGPVKKHILLG
ncbi:heterokaryon incompatibility protein-domain-containing protein [Lophiotrema nucula]|uniref:Heterokaryon incompatibility protein-domain-containing protein n=1 Tax=Lophiotrema nucula TaxID=690887 RepID=A0A6A5ZB89_9PLEO|nr:heterokaryon incompatibility protein-domain-containing protein [Lophiotrema nucula]